MRKPIGCRRRRVVFGGTERSAQVRPRVADVTYMDFPETDFHRRKNPKRSIRLRSADNLLVGITWPGILHSSGGVKVILSGFSKNTHGGNPRGAFRPHFRGRSFNSFKLEGDKISDNQMDELRATVGADINNTQGPSAPITTRRSR